MEKLSMKKFLWLIACGILAASAILLLCLFLVTKDLWLVLYGALFTAALLVWGGIFLHFFQKKLTLFADSLCRTLDDMMDNTARPEMAYEAETLLARICHHLERLYNTMQKNRNTIAKEKDNLQSLLSDISHQTKTPIANLKMLNETMLTRSITREQRKTFLQATGSQLDKLDFLIQAMVKTSRLESGAIALEKKNAPIEDALAAAINGILALMEKKNITLTVNCPEGLTVFHDSRWTSEALFNLLDNAVKYTPAGGSMGVDVQDWEMYLKIDVTDTGRGIPEREQAAIFKRFYREESVHDVDGIGIGLYLAREIITMQGGYITVTSEVGKGSTFSAFLPRK
ncbi:MAG TPA: HAMP domain-containing histidine kinase [Candidatus Scatavimonas merdigallinarum]|uniref:histidine kinase n=1 Tax=Candidatus Scatavimonas merdigallinarum TaxID=2840914 RepID=A0A9D0ZHA2_9FIRM|nr:HAMP domain-containing histidine kinase [Candidatus Scatavimonas merdigallinarum]